MAVSLYLLLLLCGRGLCQCYSELSCGGGVVPSVDQSDCCVKLSGLSYNDTGICRPCIGKKIMYHLQCLKGDSVILQFMGSVRKYMLLKKMIFLTLSLL